MTPAELRDKIAEVMPEVLGPTHRRILADAALRVVREAMRDAIIEEINAPANRGGDAYANGLRDGLRCAEALVRRVLPASPLREE